MKKTVRSKLTIFVLILALTLTQAGQVFGAISSAGTPSETNTLTASEKLDKSYVNVRAEGRTLTLEGVTPMKVDRLGINVRKVEPTPSASKWICWAYPSGQSGAYYFSASIPASKLTNGSYVLVITTTQPGASKSTVLYKNCNFKVENGKIALLQYDKILKENARIRKAAAKAGTKKFKSTSMADVRSYIFRDPITKKVATVTTAKKNYFKKVSDSVTKGSKSDYEKVLKIYEYLTKNFYYDDVAFATGTRQYTDPYRNLYNLRNKKKSANSENGKVATVCVGYAAMTTALCRAQGIPARIVNGHHVGMAADRYYNWSTEPNIKKLDHWWTEVYVDGRWITVDPTPGNGNRWNRSTNTWTYTGTTNYIFFDPTQEQLATSHLLFEVKGV